MPFIPFVEWAPDQQRAGNNNILLLTNAMPATPGYRSVQGLATVSTNSLPARCRGGIAAMSSSLQAYNFVGTDTGLFRVASSAFADVGGTYALGETDNWDFAQFGNSVIAVAWGHDPQHFAMDSSSAFAQLAASAPRAQYCATVRSFLVFGYVDSGGAVPYRVQWSPIGNPTGDWNPALSTLAGYNDLPGSGGVIQRVMGGEYGTIFREHAVWRMSFVGAPAVWQFDEVESGRGLLAPRSAVSFGRFIFYLGQDGFYVFNGGASEPIGKGKVDRTFLAELDPNYLERVTALIDPVNSLVIWSYPGAGSVGGVPNRLIFYDWNERRWGNAELACENLMLYRATGVTMEQLDAIYPNMDTDFPFTLDAREFASGAITLAAINDSHELATFTGAPLTATFDSGDLQLSRRWRKTLVQVVRPVVEGVTSAGAVTVNVGVRDNLIEDIRYEGELTADDQGECFPHEASGRYHRVRTAITGGFDHAIGFDIDGRADGER